jgi:hypothetical protein
MALTAKPLGQGQLPSSKGTLYTVPGATATLITRGTLVNTTAGALTVNVYLKTSAGSSRRIVPKDLSLAAGASVDIRGGHVVDAGGLIEGDASSATSIDYFFSGVEMA